MKKPKRGYASKAHVSNVSDGQHKSRLLVPQSKACTEDSKVSSKIESSAKEVSEKGSVSSKRLDARRYSQAVSHRFKTFLSRSSESDRSKGGTQTTSIIEESETSPEKKAYLPQKQDNAQEESILTNAEPVQRVINDDMMHEENSCGLQDISFDSKKSNSETNLVHIETATPGTIGKKSKSETNLVQVETATHAAMKSRERVNGKDLSMEDQKVEKHQPKEVLRRSSRINNAKHSAQKEKFRSATDSQQEKKDHKGNQGNLKRNICLSETGNRKKINSKVSPNTHHDSKDNALKENEEHKASSCTSSGEEEQISTHDKVQFHFRMVESGQKTYPRRRKKHFSQGAVVKFDEKENNQLDKSEKNQHASAPADSQDEETHSRPCADEWLRCTTCKKWQCVGNIKSGNFTWSCNNISCQALNFKGSNPQELEAQHQGLHSVAGLEEEESNDDLDRGNKQEPPSLKHPEKESKQSMEGTHVKEKMTSSFTKEGYPLAEMALNPACLSENGTERHGTSSVAVTETDPNLSNVNTGQPQHILLSDEYTKEDSMALQKCIDRVHLLNEDDACKENYLSPKKASVEDLSIDCYSNLCQKCKEGGELLCCDGKGCTKTYHIGCLVPPLSRVPPGEWFCPGCTMKRISLGYHSVCQGIESVWDMKEVDSEKVYFVKYKGLAHLHNRWISEKDLLKEAPKLLTSYKRKLELGKAPRWNSEWVNPHRLIQKRSLVLSSTIHGDCRMAYDNLNCKVEWYVKWSGLDYNHCTWELESTILQKSSSFKSLIEEYETRHSKAHRIIKDGLATKAVDMHDDSAKRKYNMESLSGSIDSIHFNKLKEYWQSGRHAVVIDDFYQGLISLVVKLIIHFINDVAISRPILVVTSMSAITCWESEFSQKGPFINTISYRGNKDSRDIIQMCEFFGEDNSVMVQIVLSTFDAVLMDVNRLKSLEWQAVILDGCQRHKLSKHFFALVGLSSDFRLVLLNEHLKDNAFELHSLLNFLDCNSKNHASTEQKQISNNELISSMKNKLSKYIIYERRSELIASDRFEEYWVSVDLTMVQVEQYCNLLMENKDFLGSMSKKDDFGSLRDILLSLRKCCDHPYLIDASLQSNLRKDLSEAEFLEVDIKASSKLQLLDFILSELKQQGQSVLILFQTVGHSQRMTVGDILDDHIRQRFGVDAYERVDSVLSATKKQSSLRRFNSKDSGRFVFLLEKRACGASIKLSSVSTVIIFNSDGNPINDVRALQKIHIDKDHLKIFRLYCSNTVEEGMLMSSRKDNLPDNILENMNSASCQVVLQHGVKKLFERYDRHDKTKRDTSLASVSEVDNLKSLANELFRFVSLKGEKSIIFQNNVIQRVSWADGYEKCGKVHGESNTAVTDETVPAIVFWEALLNGRLVKKHVTLEQTQRPRRKVQYYDSSSMKSQQDSEEIESRKKRRRVGGTIDPVLLYSWLNDAKKTLAGIQQSVEHNVTDAENLNFVSIDCETQKGKEHLNHNVPLPDKEGSMRLGEDDHCSSYDLQSDPSSHSPLLDGSCAADTSGNHDSFIANRSDHGVRDVTDMECENPKARMKQLLRRLSKLLQLPDTVQMTAEDLLESVEASDDFSTNPATLHAVHLSLCNVAAEYQRFSLDLEKAVKLARMQLHFECQEQDVYLWILKLRDLFPKLKAKAHCNAGVHSEPASTSNDCSPRPAQQSIVIENDDTVSSSRSNEKSKCLEVFQMQTDANMSMAPLSQNHQCHSRNITFTEKTTEHDGCSVTLVNAAEQQALVGNTVDKQVEGSNTSDHNVQVDDNVIESLSTNHIDQIDSRNMQPICSNETNSNSEWVVLSPEDARALMCKIESQRQTLLRNPEPTIKENGNQIITVCVKQIINGKISRILLDIINSGLIPGILPPDCNNTFIASQAVSCSVPLSDVILSGMVFEDPAASLACSEAHIASALSNGPEVCKYVQTNEQVSSPLVDLTQRDTEMLHDAFIPQTSLEGIQTRVTTERSTQHNIAPTIVTSQESIGIGEHRYQLLDVDNQHDTQNHQSDRDQINQSVGIPSISVCNLPSIVTTLSGPVNAVQETNTGNRIANSRSSQGVLTGLQRENLSCNLHSGVSLNISGQNTSTIPTRAIDDPLIHEMSKLRKEHARLKELYDEEMNHIRIQFEKEFDELKRRYLQLRKEKEHLFVQKRKALEVNLAKVEKNRRLAEAFKMMSEFVANASPAPPGILMRQHQQLTTLSVGRPPLAATHTPSGPSGSFTDGSSSRTLFLSGGQCSGSSTIDGSSSRTLFLSGGQCSGSSTIVQNGQINDNWQNTQQPSPQLVSSGIPSQNSQARQGISNSTARNTASHTTNRQLQHAGGLSMPSESIALIPSRLSQGQDRIQVMQNTSSPEVNCLFPQRAWLHEHVQMMSSPNQSIPTPHSSSADFPHSVPGSSISSQTAQYMNLARALDITGIVQQNAADSGFASLHVPPHGPTLAHAFDTTVPLQIPCSMQTSGATVIANAISTSAQQETQENALLNTEGSLFYGINAIHLQQNTQSFSVPIETDVSDVSCIASSQVQCKNIADGGGTIIYLSDDD